MSLDRLGQHPGSVAIALGVAHEDISHVVHIPDGPLAGR
jgi:hypothetical protein